MNKGPVGIGSASVVLIFAVVCLTVFALITLTSAQNDKALTDAEVELVKGYYGADAICEHIVAGILKGETSPGAPYGVEVTTDWDFDLGAQMSLFSCPISDRKELHVEIAVYEGFYDILSWRMRDIGTWENGGEIPVWQGVESEDSLSVWLGN